MFVGLENSSYFCILIYQINIKIINSLLNPVILTQREGKIQYPPAPVCRGRGSAGCRLPDAASPAEGRKRFQGSVCRYCGHSQHRSRDSRQYLGEEKIVNAGHRSGFPLREAGRASPIAGRSSCIAAEVAGRA